MSFQFPIKQLSRKFSQRHKSPYARRRRANPIGAVKYADTILSVIHRDHAISRRGDDFQIWICTLDGGNGSHDIEADDFGKSQIIPATRGHARLGIRFRNRRGLVRCRNARNKAAGVHALSQRVTGANGAIFPHRKVRCSSTQLVPNDARYMTIGSTTDTVDISARNKTHRGIFGCGWYKRRRKRQAAECADVRWKARWPIWHRNTMARTRPTIAIHLYWNN
jgi:hypothetical protein